MTPRLAARVQVSALIRLAQARGGSGTVLRRGDAEAGSILLWLAMRGRFAGLQERRLLPDGTYGWAAAGPPDTAPTPEIDSYVERRRAADPDLWVIELDVAAIEQLIADIAAAG